MGEPLFQRLMVLDFETKWKSKDDDSGPAYTLSKMTIEEYVRDERFHAYGLSYKWFGEKETYWVDHNALPGFVHNIDWTTTAAAAHNAQFDLFILSHHYKAVPCFIFDTLSMARALRGVEVGNSLARLAETYGLPAKGKAVYSTDGLGTQLPPDIYAELVGYCKHDTDLAAQLLGIFLCNAYTTANPFPQKELRLIDLTLRMYLQPRLRLDPHMLTTAIKEERAKREGLLTRLEVEEGDLASTAKFSKLLEQMGVSAPSKVSKTTGKGIPALAKSDAQFQALLNSENEDVAALCEARLRVKSTLERTRAQRLLDISTRGTLPVPLNYYGAHTGRWSASKGAGINLQNLKRGSFLRKAVMAPDGYVCVVADLSQIEPRVLAWLAGYEELLDTFRSGADPYAVFGAQMFGIPGLTKETHPLLRQAAKSALLGAGFQLGWASFAAQLIPGFLGAPPMLYDMQFAKQLGVTKDALQSFIDYRNKDGVTNLERALAIPRMCSDEEIVVHCVAAQTIINKYREAAWPVMNFWSLCQNAISDALAPDGEVFEHRGLRFEPGHIFLPNGMALRYPDLKFSRTDGGWSYDSNGERKKLYGGRLTENIVQAAARIVMTDGMLRIQKRYPVVLTVHDECCVLAPETEGEEAFQFMLACMTKPPKWAPDLPLAADGGFHLRYGDCKF